MKKVLGLILIMFIFLFLGVADLSAQNASVRLTSARTSVRHGQTTDVLVRIDASARIRGGQFNLGLNNNNFQIVSVNGASGFSISSSGNFHLAYRIEAGYSVASGSAIASVRLRPRATAPVGATTQVTVSNVGVTLLNHNETVSAGSRSMTLRIAETPEVVTRSNNNFLSSLSSDIVELDFERNTFEYNVTVPNDIRSLNLTATTEDDKASVEIIGDEDFATGENHVRVVVTAENGATRTYNVYVDREKSSNNLLSVLSIAGYTIDFDPETFAYQIDVTDQGLSELDITYEAADENAQVEIIGNEDLQIGRNIIRIIVTAENGDTQTYTLTVNILTDDLIITESESFSIVIIILSIFLAIVIATQIYFLIKWRKENKL